MDVEFSFVKHMLQVLKFWWVIALLAIAGGVFGYEISQVRTPVYESRGVFTVSLDFVKSGVMTDIEEDQALNTIADVINSTDVLDEVAGVMKSKGVEITPSTLRRFVSVDRQGFQIIVHVNHTSAQITFDIASTWTDIAEKTLQSAIQAAVKADSLYRQLLGLEICFQQVTVVFPTFTPCEITDAADLVSSIKRVENEYLDVKIQSRGVLSAINVDLTDHPQVPISPRIFNRSVLVISAALMGFLIGVLLVECGFIGKWSKRDAKIQ